MIHPGASFELPAQRKPVLGLGVVVLMHVLFFWALHAGLGRKLLQSAPVVVVAQLLSDAPAPAPASAPTPVPPPTVAIPPPKPVALPPVLASEPIVAPTEAGEVSAAPFSLEPAAPAILTSNPVVATGAVSEATRSPAAAVRVAAALQASGTCAKPAYPDLSRRREEQGSVQLKFLIGTDGRVLESHVERSSGYARLDEAARLGLSQCQFKPGTVDGTPEPSWASLKYTWRLE